MRMFTIRRCVVAATLGALAVVVYLRRVEPWLRGWGATDDDRSRHLSMDDLVEPGLDVTTRALSVRAPIDLVWPWLVQIGQDRAGFYSYTVLENLIGANMHNANAVVPGWQQRHAGDSVWLAEQQRWHERGRQVAAVVDPPHSLVLVSPSDWARLGNGGRTSGAWGFFLLAETADRTRLLVRTSGGAVGTHAFDLLHFVMEQKMMRGLRDRAEAHDTRSTSAR
jgi:hypothetical protein